MDWKVCPFGAMTTSEVAAPGAAAPWPLALPLCAPGLPLGRCRPGRCGAPEPPPAPRRPIVASGALTWPGRFAVRVSARATRPAFWPARAGRARARITGAASACADGSAGCEADCPAPLAASDLASARGCARPRRDASWTSSRGDLRRAGPDPAWALRPARGRFRPVLEAQSRSSRILRQPIWSDRVGQAERDGPIARETRGS